MVFYSPVRERFLEKPTAFRKVLQGGREGWLSGPGAAHRHLTYYPHLVRLTEIDVLSRMWFPYFIYWNIPFPWRHYLVLGTSGPGVHIHGKAEWLSENVNWLWNLSKSRLKGSTSLRPERPSLPKMCPLPADHIHTSLVALSFSPLLFTFGLQMLPLSTKFLLYLTFNQSLIIFPTSAHVAFVLGGILSSGGNPEFWGSALFHPHVSITFINCIDLTQSQ